MDWAVEVPEYQAWRIGVHLWVCIYACPLTRTSALCIGLLVGVCMGMCRGMCRGVCQGVCQGVCRMCHHHNECAVVTNALLLSNGGNYYNECWVIPHWQAEAPCPAAGCGRRGRRCRYAAGHTQRQPRAGRAAPEEGPIHIRLRIDAYW